MENDTRVDITGITDPRKAIVCTMVHNGMQKVMTEETIRRGGMDSLDESERSTLLLALEKYAGIACALVIKTETDEDADKGDRLDTLRDQAGQLQKLALEIGVPLPPMDMMIIAATKDAKNLLHVIVEGTYDPEVGPAVSHDSEKLEDVQKMIDEKKYPKLTLPPGFNRN